MEYIALISGIITTIAAGGWFINFKEKKRLETYTADKAKTESYDSEVNLLDKIMDRYKTDIFDKLDTNSEQHNQQHKEIKSELASISEYLNGGYADFKVNKTSRKK